MKDLQLVYIHEVGRDYKDRYFYEFIFSDTLEGINGENWDDYPAGGNPYPPDEKFIVQVGKLDTDLKLLVLIQNNEQFSMWDAIDGVIALGWENIEGLEDYPENRLTFPFGMPIKDVEALLYERDMIMKYEKKLTNE